MHESDSVSQVVWGFRSTMIILINQVTFSESLDSVAFLFMWETDSNFSFCHRQWNSLCCFPYLKYLMLLCLSWEFSRLKFNRVSFFYVTWITKWCYYCVLVNAKQFQVGLRPLYAQRITSSDVFEQVCLNGSLVRSPVSSEDGSMIES